MKGKLPYILLVLMIVAGVVSWGIGTALAAQTLSPRWIALTAAAILALTSLPLTLREKDGARRSTTQRILRGLLHLFVAGGVGYLAILGINRLGATEAKSETVIGEVTARMRHRHTRTRRVGRGRYVPDGHYYTYGAVVTLPDGRKTEQHLSLEEYNRTRTGTKREVTVSRGWLGMPVVVRMKKLSKNKETGGSIRKKKTKERME
ncbi:hypothetical protein [Paramuribaculum intestinale]|uniref:hypothetical protein n=1 Tax=Paramuribaculum intestinale TaxID=2094151 RepID=UPI0025A93990|nr:hypothetical protein [Paramuribaculum intestinale]